MRSTARLLIASAAALAAALASPPAPAAAQGDGWNAPRALELIRRAQARRAETLADTGLVDYQADARGFVYFYLDRRDVDERTLVKTDQVALEVLWKAPDRSKQRIVGLRDEKSLPTNIHYHEDHLTVVQDNFGDLIRLGDGDEVRDVLHPAAPSSEAQYDFRLADSLAIRLPQGDPVRVYRLETRPKDPSRPALIGSVFVDVRAGDIVRMEFTFTAASYVDRQLDYINIALENGLFKGRFWLPTTQQVELRRQLPELGFPAGGVIRGTMRVSNYRFNQGLEDWRFQGRRVVSVPEAQRRAFAFEEPIDAELKEAGLGPDTELADVRRQAAELIRGRMLSGLPVARLDVPAVSSVARYNRAEGPVAAFGTTLTPREQLTLSVHGGFAFGAAHPVAGAEAVWERPRWRLTGTGSLFEPRDVGVGPVVSGAMNTLSALFAGSDYLDPFYATGGALRLEGPVGRGWTGAVTGRVEDHESAELEADFSFGGDFRPVRAVDEGLFTGGALSFSRASASGRAFGWRATVGADGGRLDAGEGFTFVRPRLDLGAVRRWTPRDARLEVDFGMGAAFGDLPRQGLYLVGGRGTVPGYAFRRFGGDRFAVARATGSADLLSPFFRGRAFVAGGWTEVGAAGETSLAAWGAEVA
ncbi:MAG TPA: hypothetical protein VHG91_16705, partial [Longimicrobium sp.]|nr:hypothetical protein [Longimicrobium sp.]